MDTTYHQSVDALLVINSLNRRSTNIRVRNAGVGVAQQFLDVNGDGRLSPIDALLVINKLNRQRGSGEWEGAEWSDSDTGSSNSDWNHRSVDKLLASWSASELEQLTKRRTRRS